MHTNVNVELISIRHPISKKILLLHFSHFCGRSSSRARPMGGNGPFTPVLRLIGLPMSLKYLFIFLPLYHSFLLTWKPRWVIYVAMENTSDWDQKCTSSYWSWNSSRVMCFPQKISLCLKQLLLLFSLIEVSGWFSKAAPCQSSSLSWFTSPPETLHSTLLQAFCTGSSNSLLLPTPQLINLSLRRCLFP